MKKFIAPGSLCFTPEHAEIIMPVLEANFPIVKNSNAVLVGKDDLPGNPSYLGNTLMIMADEESLQYTSSWSEVFTYAAGMVKALRIMEK